MTKVFDTVIVGAGAAGLSAAKQLIGSGASIVVLEASDKVGGRVQHDTCLDPRWPIELGPEFVHGEFNNKLLDLIKDGLVDKPNAEVVELEWPNYYYFGKEGRLVDAKAADDEPEISAMHEVFEEIEDLEKEKAAPNGTLENQSLLQFFAGRGVGSRVIDLADAIFANDYGAEASEIGIRECIEEQKRWTYGEKYLVLKGASLQDAMDTLARGLPVQTGWPVQYVRALARGSGADGNSDAAVEVGDGAGRRVLARSVIVTVPLSVLQRGDLRFEPPLPPPQREAVSSLGMGNALKCVVKLSRRIWPADFYDAVCADCFFPEVWLSPAAQLMDPECPGPYTVVGFVAGKRAERVGELEPAEVARLLLGQLDAMFGSAQDPNPASGACEGFPSPSSFAVKDWKKAPFTHGAYSFPTLGAAKETRLAIGQDLPSDSPHAGALFFAGEWTSPGVNACIHGAMDTGCDAAGRVLASLTRVSDRSLCSKL